MRFIKYLLYMLSYFLECICAMQHEKLSDIHDDKLQELWIKIFGYHCPFAIWSENIDRKFNLGVWR